MTKKRTRDRHLAKLAAQRKADRDARRRRRGLALGSVVGILVIGGAIYGATQIFGDNEKAAASPTPSSSVAPGVACGATAPKTAGEQKPTFKKAPKMTIDTNATYTATFETSCGKIVAELYPKVAPIGVNNFVFLANKGFYDGLTFSRIVQGFVIQGGDPGSGGPGYQFAIETDKSVTFDAPGLLAYANGGPGTNGSQFFFTLAKLPQLDPTPQASYTIFGKVTSGLSVVDKIGKIPTTTGPNCAGPTESCQPLSTVYVDSVKVTEQK